MLLYNEFVHVMETERLMGCGQRDSGGEKRPGARYRQCNRGQLWSLTAQHDLGVNFFFLHFYNIGVLMVCISF